MMNSVSVNQVDGRIVWIDCEMTGLDPNVDVLVEVAALVTDADLNVLGDGVQVVIKPPQAALEQMGDFVHQMHTESGLLDELASGVTVEEAEQQVLGYIKEFIPARRKAPLGGNSVGTDRTFLAKYMPELEDHVHYRNVDVSSIKELAKRWFPRVYYAAPEKHGGHRALADITESINELKYFREVLFVAGPGPDTATARTVAAKYEIAPETDESTAD